MKDKIQHKISLNLLRNGFFVFRAQFDVFKVMFQVIDVIIIVIITFNHAWEWRVRVGPG
jgi:hypothetical protein